MSTFTSRRSFARKLPGEANGLSAGRRRSLRISASDATAPALIGSEPAVRVILMRFGPFGAGGVMGSCFGGIGCAMLSATIGPGVIISDGAIGGMGEPPSEGADASALGLSGITDAGWEAADTFGLTVARLRVF